MRSADDITAMWKAWNIKPDQQVSFYCGTGCARQKPLCTHAQWAGITSPFTTVAGMNGAAIQNPVATGERGPDSSK